MPSDKIKALAAEKEAERQALHAALARGEISTGDHAEGVRKIERHVRHFAEADAMTRHFPTHSPPAPRVAE